MTPPRITFFEAEILAFKSPDSLTLAEHRKIVIECSEANRRVTSTISNSETLVRNALVEANVSDRILKSTMDGLNEGHADRQILLRIRNCERQICEATLAAIDLLETTRGYWTRNEVSGELTFDCEGDLKRFTDFSTAIETASVEEGKEMKNLAAATRARNDRAKATVSQAEKGAGPASGR